MLVTIRPYQKSDFDDVTRLRFESWNSTGQTEDLSYVIGRIRKKVEQKSPMYVATIASDVVGFIAFHEDRLDNLFVTPKMQGRSIGRQLLEFTKKQMPNGFWLTTTIGNERGIKFYEREGLTRGVVSIHARYGSVVRFEWCPVP